MVARRRNDMANLGTLESLERWELIVEASDGQDEPQARTHYVCGSLGDVMLLDGEQLVHVGI